MKQQFGTSLLASILVFSGASAFAGEDSQHDKSVENRMDSTEMAIKDAWLDGKLESSLMFNEHLNSFDIDTDVKNRVAILSGSVESDIDRDLAGEIAESIKGVEDVKNNLTVNKDGALAMPYDDEAQERNGFKRSVQNATLTARIKTELLLNSNTAGLSIDVDSQDAVVTLSGEVKSEQEKELAGQIAQNATDTRTVENRLEVVSGS